MLVSLEARVLSGDRIRQVAKQIANCMRDYDLCCRIGPREFMIIFPGASTEGCSSIVSRLSQRLAEARIEEGVRIGSATWDDDGTTAKDLIRSAEHSVESGQRGSTSREAERLTTVWFEGVANAIRAKAVQTAEGLRLRVPLGFVRVGASVSFDAGDGGRRTGRVAEAAIGGGRRSAPVPVLQVDVNTL
jgi:GGDEF domain-containing protein